MVDFFLYILVTGIVVIPALFIWYYFKYHEQGVREKVPYGFIFIGFVLLWNGFGFCRWGCADYQSFSDIVYHATHFDLSTHEGLGIPMMLSGTVIFSLGIGVFINDFRKNDPKNY